MDGSLHDELATASHAGVVAHRRPGRRDRGARPGREHRRRPQASAERTAARLPSAAGGVMGRADADLARRAWRAMSDLVLDHDRKVAVSEALGLSFARVRALRRLAAEPLTLRALAERLAADPPYVTLIVDDLEERGLVQRTPHPEDRRAKLVQLTAAGRAAAARADDDPGRAARRAARRARRGPRGPAARARAPRLAALTPAGSPP